MFALFVFMISVAIVNYLIARSHHAPRPRFPTPLTPSPPHPLMFPQLGGVPALVKLLSSDDREVLRNTCLALTCCAKHPEALPQMYSLKSMKLLIELLSNGNEDVQEQASYTIGHAVFGEDNMKDFRRARLAHGCIMFKRRNRFHVQTLKPS
jgi:hypothetical protein